MSEREYEAAWNDAIDKAAYGWTQAARRSGKATEAKRVLEEMIEAAKAEATAQGLGLEIVHENGATWARPTDKLPVGAVYEGTKPLEIRFK